MPIGILLTLLNLSIFASTLISLTRADVRMTTTRQVLQAAKEALNHIVSHLLQKDDIVGSDASVVVVTVAITRLVVDRCVGHTSR